MSEVPAAPVEVQSTPEQPAEPVGEELMAEEQDSLLMFGEEDEDFDPLKRSSSVGQRTGSLSGKPAPPTSQKAQVPPPSASVGGGDNLLGDLSGLDLSANAPSANSVAPTSTPSIQDILRPLQTSTLPPSQPLITSATPLSTATPLSQPTQIPVCVFTVC